MLFGTHKRHFEELFDICVVTSVALLGSISATFRFWRVTGDTLGKRLSSFLLPKKLRMRDLKNRVHDIHYMTCEPKVDGFVKFGVSY